MKKTASIACTILFLAGLTVLFWPKLQGAVIQQQSQTVVEDFIEQLEEKEPEKPHRDLYKAMREYNRELYLSHQAGLRDPWAYESSGFDLISHGIEDAVIGVLEIPDINVSLPIYLGATRENLAKGVAVLGQTSMPIGGTDTNCVIAGHRGYRGADFLLDLPQLQAGATVRIVNLWETLEYTVTDTRVIAPDGVDNILIQDNRDMLTLLTCHPYASGGKQRWVVFCERTERT